jgi:hypothetical protein
LEEKTEGRQSIKNSKFKIKNAEIGAARAHAGQAQHSVSSKAVDTRGRPSFFGVLRLVCDTAALPRWLGRQIARSPANSIVFNFEFLILN